MKTFIVAMVIFLVMLVGTECYINWLDSVSEELAQQTAVMHDVVARDDWSACQEKMASFLNSGIRCIHGLNSLSIIRRLIQSTTFYMNWMDMLKCRIKTVFWCETAFCKICFYYSLPANA